MPSIIPSGWSVEPTDHYLTDKMLVGPSDERVFLTNRPWSRINHSFNTLPALAIQAMSQEVGDSEPVVVLDLGAGIERTASDELQRHKKLGSRILVIGVDYTVSGEDHDAEQLVADLFRIPLAHDSVDIVYSRQALSVITEGKPLDLEAGLAEITRVLKPGGLAFIDEGWYATGWPKRFRETSIETPQGAKLYTAKARTFESLVKRFIHRLQDNQYDNARFLILAKEPDDKLLDRIAKPSFGLQPF